MFIDYHTHTYLCGHGEGKPIDYALKAAEFGLLEIGISDHMPMGVWRDWDPRLTMGVDDFPLYVELVHEAKKSLAGRLPVKFGIEADYQHSKEYEIRTFLDKYPFDYVIGSLHYLEDWGVDNPWEKENYDGKEADQLFANYFAEIVHLCKSKMYNILGHADLIKIFGIQATGDFSDWYKRIAEALSENNMAIELNTAGWFKPCEEQYPTVKLLQACFENGVPVVISSDAHSPENVGRCFKEAAQILQSIGYKEQLAFSERAPEKLIPF